MAKLTVNGAVTVDYSADGWAEYKKWLDGTYATLQYAWADEGASYSIAAFDGLTCRVCGLNKADAADFEANYKVTTSTQSPVDLQAVTVFNVSPTYSAEASVAGVNNKILLGLLNPAGSGKTYKVWAYWVLVPSSSGATVVIPVELRSITTLTAGTDVVPFKFDENDPASGAVVKADAPAVTDAGLILTRIFQVNSAQYSQGYEVPLKLGDSAKPLMLKAGKGVCLKMIASNTSTFRVGLLWTQE